MEVHTEAGKNYEAGSQTFSFEIKKAPLSVKAVDQNVTVGDAIPEYTVLYEGFAGTDTADVLNGSLQFTCEYAPDSAAGDYAIQPSGLTSENYEIHFENGTLHAVRKASSGSDDSDNSGGSGSTKNPAATNFGKNVSNSSSSENDAQEPGNAMKRAGGSNSRTAPIRQEKRPVIRTVKSWAGSRKTENGGFSVLTAI